MSTRNISLPEDLARYVDEQVASGRFDDASKYVGELIERDRHREIRKDVEAKLLKAIQSPAEPMNDADWEALEREGDRLISERRRVS